jgi:cytochrome b subunit of formate dehydrogenase
MRSLLITLSSFVRRTAVILGLALFGFCGPVYADDTKDAITPIEVDEHTTNDKCTACHGVEGFAVPKGEHGFTEKRHLSFDVDAFGESAHGERQCVECHTDIKQLPHRKNLQRAVDCISCHVELWDEIEKNKQKQPADRNVADKNVSNVVEQIEHYLSSVHAQPNKEAPDRPNATCVDCHSAHYVFPIRSKEGQSYRLTTPEVCGKCHEKQLGDYQDSVHGLAVARFGNNDAAVCADCHTAHEISKAKGDPAKLRITENCGSCHEEEYKSYRHTYHGQVSTLGYTHTAKCFDCHAHHKTREIDDERSKVHMDNRLKTCQTCHEDAAEGFLHFHPHGTTHNLKKYPYMWVASKFMILLLAGVFTFFWTHSALWFYREWKDRKEGKSHVLVNDGDAVEVPEKECKHVRRFSWQWRLAHLVLAIAVMILVLTGTSVLYADSFWAPVVIKMFGGPKVAAIIHRICAVTFAIIFFGHILYSLYNTMIKNRKTFRWFGPYSLLPRWQDFRDFLAMANWFAGTGPRPVFDHWTYWEKFDYWAPFWGMFIIGLSGLMLWFPNITASYLPGWVFNVATIVHGEEAFLAAVFLFTVHYFNCHWRPDKLPQDIVMFTGTMPLEEFKHERKIEYDRLVANGELDKYLVDPPSKAMTLGSKILGMTLIVIGVVLLLLVLAGFWEGVLFG